jgi:hypothetical protein
MATPAVHNPPAHASPLELETLQLLPCGCVTAIRRVRSWEFLVVSIEAKGPHCNQAAHRLGRVVFGDRQDLVADDEDDEPAAG